MLQTMRNPAAADIWALGVTFYFLLVGHMPFSDKEMTGKKPNSSSPEPLQQLADRVCAQDLLFPETLSASWTYVLRRMLEKDPSRRAKIQEIQELVYRLEDELLAEQPGFQTEIGLLKK